MRGREQRGGGSGERDDSGGMHRAARSGPGRRTVVVGERGVRAAIAVGLVEQPVHQTL